ncbi:Patj, partial [Folsomia candida]
FNTKNALVQVIELSKPFKDMKFGVNWSYSDHIVGHGLVVSGITVGSNADLDGRLQRGDKIILANSLNLAKMSGKAGSAALMKELQTTLHVRLVVARSIRNDAYILPSNVVAEGEDLDKYLVDERKFNTENALVQVIELSKPFQDMKFGFSTYCSEYIVGLIVSDITLGSVADLGGLQRGDKIILVNSLNIAKMSGKEGAAAVKNEAETNVHIRLVVARPIRNDAYILPRTMEIWDIFGFFLGQLLASAITVLLISMNESRGGNSNQNDPDNISLQKRPLQRSLPPERPFQPLSPAKIRPLNNFGMSTNKINAQLAQFNTDNALVQTIELSKPVVEVKFGVAASTSQYHVGLRVDRIEPGSSIKLDGRLQLGSLLKPRSALLPLVNYVAD